VTCEEAKKTGDEKIGEIRKLPFPLCPHQKIFGYLTETENFVSAAKENIGAAPELPETSGIAKSAGKVRRKGMIRAKKADARQYCTAHEQLCLEAATDCLGENSDFYKLLKCLSSGNGRFFIRHIIQFF